MARHAGPQQRLGAKTSTNTHAFILCVICMLSFKHLNPVMRVCVLLIIGGLTLVVSNTIIMNTLISDIFTRHGIHNTPHTDTTQTRHSDMIYRAVSLPSRRLGRRLSL